MRRALLFAFAIILCGFAQAITSTWTQSGALVTGGSVSLNGSAGTSFSVALVFTLDTLPNETGKTLLSVASDQNKTLLLATGNTTGGVSGGTATRVPEGNANFGQLKTGENIIGIIIHMGSDFVDPDDKGDTGLSVDFYVNGTFCGTNRPYWGSASVDDAVSSLTVGAYDGKWYAGSGVATAEDFSSLPEPTALALLALGVAGVALRRRVA